MENPLEKPKIGIRERLRAVLSGDVDWPKPGVLRHEGMGRMMEYVREIDAAVLKKRLPLRNVDGSVNWPNYFAWKSGLGKPLKKADVFSDGERDIDSNQAYRRVIQVMKKAALWEDGIEIDPVEFPEIVDEDFRTLTAKMNHLDFLRTTQSCSGHAEKSNGFIRSFTWFLCDTKNPNSIALQRRLKELEGRYTTEQTEVKISEINQEQCENIGSFKIDLVVRPPEGWNQEADHVDDNEVLVRILKIDGEYRVHLIPPENEKYYQQKRLDPAFMAEHRRLKAWGQSKECKEIRGQFWKEVERIVDSFQPT